MNSTKRQAARRNRRRAARGGSARHVVETLEPGDTRWGRIEISRSGTAVSARETLRELQRSPHVAGALFRISLAR